MVREHVECLFWNQIFSGLDGTYFLSKYVVIRQNIDNELNILLKWGLASNMKGKLLYSLYFSSEERKSLSLFVFSLRE